MKNFVLGILNVFAWIFEFIFGLGAILSIITGIIFLIPNIQETFLKQVPNLKNTTGTIVFAVFALIISAVMCAALCWGIRAIRLVIRNINQDIYFDEANLDLLHTTLISLSVFTLANFIEACLIGAARYNLRRESGLNLDFSNIVYSLIILGIIYVIYLVFKNGLKLQEDSNKII